MRFKCRATREERVLEAEELKRWRRWFAWRPIRMSWGDCVWLETVERREPHVWVASGPRFEVRGGGVYEYRLTSRSS